MQINVTVEDIESVDLATTVETRSRYDSDGEREDREITIGHLVAEMVTKKLSKDDSWSGIKKRFLEIRDEEIRAAVKPIVEAAITGPIRLTNTFGEPTGPETTLNALIVDQAKRAIVGDRGDYGRGDTLAQRVIKDAVGAAFAAELSKSVADEKAKVVAAVRAKAAELIAEAVKQGVGPR